MVICACVFLFIAVGLPVLLVCSEIDRWAEDMEVQWYIYRDLEQPSS